jgi:signal transduction histidine kinase
MTLEVDRLGRLVADLLTLAQLEAGSLRLNREPVPAAGLLADVATMMRLLASASGMTIVVDAPDEALEAYCDRDRITQVLVVLVDNALKHSERDGAVTLSAKPRDDDVTLAIHNDGDAIDPEVIPRLFDRFFRVDESRTTPKGTGLGLSIAKEIVEAHGSTIDVESAPGKGTTFRFNLPGSAQ